MTSFEYTVTTEKPFEKPILAIEKKAGEKGYPREPLKIIEICNAKYASQVLGKDVKISLMLPYPISVYGEGGKTHISTLLPTSTVQFFPRAGIESLASEVEDIVLKIIEEAR